MKECLGHGVPTIVTRRPVARLEKTIEAVCELGRLKEREVLIVHITSVHVMAKLLKLTLDDNGRNYVQIATMPECRRSQ